MAGSSLARRPRSAAAPPDRADAGSDSRLALEVRSASGT